MRILMKTDWETVLKQSGQKSKFAIQICIVFQLSTF